MLAGREVREASAWETRIENVRRKKGMNVSRNGETCSGPGGLPHSSSAVKPWRRCPLPYRCVVSCTSMKWFALVYVYSSFSIMEQAKVQWKTQDFVRIFFVYVCVFFSRYFSRSECALLHAPDDRAHLSPAAFFRDAMVLDGDGHVGRLS